ncbi:MAG: hypothetical protein R3D43_12260 [Tepidamorphaceae bacterium]
MITGRTNGISSITAAAASSHPQQQRGRAEQAETPARPASRALVPVTGPRPKSDSHPKTVLNPARGSAAFLTQLIASEIGVESMRARRRAAPDFAASAYAASAARPQVYRPQRRLGSL